MHTKCNQENGQQDDDHPCPFHFPFDAIHDCFFFKKEQKEIGIVLKTRQKNDDIIKKNECVLIHIHLRAEREGFELFSIKLYFQSVNVQNFIFCSISVAIL